MLNLTNVSIISFVLLLLIIGIMIIMFVKKDFIFNYKKSVPLIFIMIILVALFSLPFILSSQNDKKREYFDQLIIEQSDIESLELVSINQKNELRNPESNEIITYLSLNKPYTLRYYEPVYLKSFDDYHLIIYSSKNASYDDGIFQHPDYAFHINADMMVLLHKSSKRLIPLYDSEMTGKNIRLDGIIVSGNSILIPTPRNNQIHPIYFHGFTVNPLYLSNGTPRYYYERLMGFEHYQTESNYIKYYALSKDEILLWVNDLGDVFIEQHIVHFRHDGSSSQITKRPNTILNTKTYVKAGAFTIISGDIYYLDDDLSVRKIITLDLHEIVGVAQSLEDWIDDIPNV